jgi:hypothetical protein
LSALRSAAVLLVAAAFVLAGAFLPLVPRSAQAGNPGAYPPYPTNTPYPTATYVYQYPDPTSTPTATSTPTPTPTPTATPTDTPPAAPQATSTPTSTATPTATPTPSPTTTSAPIATNTVLVLSSLALTVTGSLREAKSGSLHVLVQNASTGDPVAAARVLLDGRRVGISSIRKSKTDSKGAATFKHVRPTKTGKLLLTASKSGMVSAKKQLKVKH